MVVGCSEAWRGVCVVHRCIVWVWGGEFGGRRAWVLSQA